MRTSSRTGFAIGTLLLVVCLVARSSSEAATEEFYFHHDHILGTSLDVWMVARPEEDVEKIESAILAEIERLRQVFSLYDATSELSRLNQTREAVSASNDMIAVLKLYESWQRRTGGALNGRVGALVELWKQAEKDQREPEAAGLKAIVDGFEQPGWRIDEANRTVTRIGNQSINLNAIARGYIIHKATEAARAQVPALRGLLLNLGGDMSVVGSDETGKAGWTVAIQNPNEPYDNVESISLVRLKDMAMASSGGYQRFYSIKGVKHSHIFDPRTGQSATGAAGATVIARDNETANALATTLTVLDPENGIKLVESVPGAHCLIVTKDGKRLRSSGFASLEVSQPIIPVMFQDTAADKDNKRDAGPWPADFQVTMSITIPEAGSAKRYRRPYLAAWVENENSKPVRTITVWGNSPKWIRELPAWWKFAQNDPAAKAVSRATRGPGQYSIVWDGKDDAGKAVPRGTYTVQIEVHREHGKLVRQTGKIVCGDEPAQIKLEKNAETGQTIVDYAKKK
jgi:thiamine biosynthesis lipoprotein